MTTTRGFTGFRTLESKQLKRPMFLLWLWGASLLGVAAPGSAQSFVEVPGALTTISAGGASVWGLNTLHHVYRYKQSTVSFAQVPGPLTQIAVGGGNVTLDDDVWGVNTLRQIYRYNYRDRKSVWGVNTLRQIYRYNY